MEEDRVTKRAVNLLESVLQGRRGLDLGSKGAGTVGEGVMKAERAGGVSRGDGLGGGCGYDAERGGVLLEMLRIDRGRRWVLDVYHGGC
jgi:hypothetical protein